VDTAQFSPSARLALRAEARRRRAIHETDFVLLLIGNDWRAKGLETVLHAMSSLRGLPFLVIAAGDDSPGSFLEITKTLGISERCRFEPSRPDVLDFYAAADLYVSTSQEDLSVCPLPKPWPVASRPSPRFLPVYPPYSTMESIASSFATRTTPKHSPR